MTTQVRFYTPRCSRCQFFQMPWPGRRRNHQDPFRREEERKLRVRCVHPPL